MYQPGTFFATRQRIFSLAQRLSAAISKPESVGTYIDVTQSEKIHQSVKSTDSISTAPRDRSDHVQLVSAFSEYIKAP
jgi:hypothetical protein